MRLIINGESREVAATHVQQLVAELELDHKLIVVEVEGRIIDQDQWVDCRLEEGMKLELVHFVGGG